MKAVVDKVSFDESMLQVTVSFYLSEGEAGYDKFFRVPTNLELNVWQWLACKAGLLGLWEKCRVKLGKPARTRRLFAFRTEVLPIPLTTPQATFENFVRGKISDFKKAHKAVISNKWEGLEIKE